jgi:MOSC domain-containing protein YiiM
MKTVGSLLSRHLQNIKPGTLQWIGLRPERKAPINVVEQVMALSELGLEGDRRSSGRPGSARQVTLINQEHIAVIEQLLGINLISPELLRRNLVVSGINLLALRHQRFRIGTAEFEATAQCHPCLRMEQALGQGAVGAMLGHGGICAKILKSGLIRVGDRVEKI